MGLELLFGVVYIAWGIIAGLSLTQLKGFLRQTESIADASCIGRFKSMVRIQMYAALGVTGLLVAGMIVGLVLITRHGLVGFITVMGVNALVIVSALYVRKVEVKTRQLQAATETLGAEYREICNAWVKKPFPDF